MNEFITPSNIDLDIDKVSTELRIRPEVYTRIVVSFVNSLGGKMKKLNEALSDNDRDGMRMILHEIKGTAGNLRLSNIMGPEDVMHIAVKAGEGQPQLLKYFETLRREVENLQQYVNLKFEPGPGDK